MHIFDDHQTKVFEFKTKDTSDKGKVIGLIKGLLDKNEDNLTKEEVLEKYQRLREL